jgi:lactate 2-monooxygenase
MKTPFTSRQSAIYLDGFAGTKPLVPIDAQQLEQRARQALTPAAFAYIAGGAGLEDTVAANRSAFGRHRIVPRMLCDVSTRDTSTDLLGMKLPAPLLLSPVGVLELVHPQADVAVAKAAAALSVPYIFSSQASKPMEEVAAVMGGQPRWFQLYWGKSNELAASFVRRAEACGCSAIVVTLDTTLLGWRTRDLDLAYLPFLEGKGIAQYTSDPVFQKMLDEPRPRSATKVTAHTLRNLVSMVNAYPGKGFIKKLRSGRPVKAVQQFVNMYSNPALTWKDLRFLRDCTRLPILLKGILHPDDARLALTHGMDGLIVSNHGGRQVDGAIGTLEALPRVVEAVQGKIPVLIDGGIRGGADMFKALALGAKAVCIGRPYVYALAIAGQAGVEQYLRHLLADFELTMALAGCSRASEISMLNLSQ